MPRKLRIQYPGAMYHVMSRGDRREKIFLDDIDRQDFIKTLAEACQKTGWQVHAYCLMPNHYHVALETPEPNLVAGMAWLQSGRCFPEWRAAWAAIMLENCIRKPRGQRPNESSRKSCSVTAGRNRTYSLASRMIPSSWRLRLGRAAR